MSKSSQGMPELVGKLCLYGRYYLPLQRSFLQKPYLFHLAQRWGCKAFWVEVGSAALQEFSLELRR